MDDEIVCESHIQGVGRHNKRDKRGGEWALNFTELEYGGCWRCKIHLVLSKTYIMAYDT